MYDELRRLAAARLAHEPPGTTLQATALVHEAFLRLQSAGRLRFEPGPPQQHARAALMSPHEPYVTA